MKRNYSTGTTDAVIFFTGKEVEKTPAYGLDTLFVTGVQPIDDVKQALAKTTYEINHIFFGANHSFNPNTKDEWDQWDQLIMHFLENGYLCSLDIPITKAEDFHESSLCSYSFFIPQVRISLPYMQLWNYNTMIKFDDKGFDKTNPGVWCHSLHDLKDRKKFTSWHEYKNDKIIK